MKWWQFFPSFVLQVKVGTESAQLRETLVWKLRILTQINYEAHMNNKKKIGEIWEIIDTEAVVDGESFKESTRAGWKTLASTGHSSEPDPRRVVNVERGTWSPSPVWGFQSKKQGMKNNPWCPRQEP